MENIETAKTEASVYSNRNQSLYERIYSYIHLAFGVRDAHIKKQKFC